MTRDEILQWAKEKGVYRTLIRIPAKHPADNEILPAFGIFVEELEEFAELIAAAECERCAKVCEDLGEGFMKRHDPKSNDLSDVMLRQIVVLGWNGAAQAIRRLTR